MNIDFDANKTALEVIEEGAFGETYLRGIYSDINDKQSKNSRKELDELKNIDQKYYYSNYYDVNVNKYGVKSRASLRFWESNSVGPYGCFQWYFRYWLGKRFLDDER